MEFKITVLKILKTLMGKMDNMHSCVGISAEIKTIRKIKRECYK